MCPCESENPLDIWIMARLAEVRDEVTRFAESYEIDKAVRPFPDFIDDLSTWYLRRSRDRFKADRADAAAFTDKEYALATTRYVLLTLAKLLAPFMPFFAEELYLALRRDNDLESGEESVHLCDWPEDLREKGDDAVIAAMTEVRNVVTAALEARAKANIKVRQPLAKLTVKVNLPAELLALVKDEVNVKEVVSDAAITERVVLDTMMTAELKEEGVMREVTHAIQDLRKKKGLTIADRPTVRMYVAGPSRKTLEKLRGTIEKGAQLAQLEFADAVTEGEKLSLDGEEIILNLI